MNVEIILEKGPCPDISAGRMGSGGVGALIGGYPVWQQLFYL